MVTRSHVTNNLCFLFGAVFWTYYCCLIILHFIVACAFYCSCLVAQQCYFNFLVYFHSIFFVYFHSSIITCSCISLSCLLCHLHFIFLVHFKSSFISCFYIVFTATLFFGFLDIFTVALFFLGIFTSVLFHFLVHFQVSIISLFLYILTAALFRFPCSFLQQLYFIF